MKVKVKMASMSELVQMVAKVPIEPFEYAKKGEVSYHILKFILNARAITGWIEVNHPEDLVNIKVI